MEYKIIQMGLELVKSFDMFPAQNSENVTISIERDEDFSTHVLTPCVTYMEDGKMTSRYASYDLATSSFVIPPICFKNSGEIAITLRLSKDNEAIFTSPVKIRIRHIGNISPTALPPASEIWESIAESVVDQYFTINVKEKINALETKAKQQQTQIDASIKKFDQHQAEVTAYVEQKTTELNNLTTTTKQDIETLKTITKQELTNLETSTAQKVDELKTTTRQELDALTTKTNEAISLVGDYEVLSEDPTQIRFKKADGTFGDYVDLGGNLADKNQVNTGHGTYIGNEYHGLASDYGIEIESIKGNYSQEKTNGYQLFDASRLPTKTQGGATATNNGDGSFTITGSGTLSENFTLVATLTHNETIKLLKVGKLALVQNGNTFPRAVVNLLNGSGTKNYFSLNETATYVNITEEMLSDSNSRLVIYISGAIGGTIKSGTIKPMLYQDGDGAWEKFTGGVASPNYEYPQEPKFFEMSEICSTSKNMFNFELIKDTSCVGGSKTYDDNSITLTASTTDCYDNSCNLTRNKFKIKVKPNTKYTLLFKRSASLKGTAYVFEYDKTGKVLTPYQSNGNISKFFATTITTKSNCDYVNFRVGLVTIGDTCTFSDFMFLEGEHTWDSVGDFIPYVGSSNTPTNMLLRSLPNDVCDTYENGTIIRRIGEAIFDGSNDEDWRSEEISTNGYLRFSIPFEKQKVGSNSLICEKFFVRTSEVHGAYEYVYALSSFDSPRLYVQVLQSRGVTDMDTFKTWLKANPVTVWHELRTSVAEPFDIPKIPSYNPRTNAWHDSKIEAKEIKWKINVYDHIEAQEKFVEEDYIKIIESNGVISTSSNRGGAELLELNGAYEQDSTNGYQLFDQSKLSTKTQGGATVTNNGDGSFTVSGSGNLTENLLIYYNYTHEESVKLLKEGKINLKCDTTTYPYFCMKLTDSTNTNQYLVLSNESKLESSGSILQTLLDNTSTFIRVSIYGASGQPIKSGTIKPMLFQDGDGTWEQFTGGNPSPNPNYQQKIKGLKVGKVVSHGRQLFDQSRLKTKYVGGATITNNNDGSFTVGGGGTTTGAIDIRGEFDHEKTLNILKTGTLRLGKIDSTYPYFWYELFFDGKLQSKYYLNNRESGLWKCDITSDILSKSDLKIVFGFWGDANQTIKSGTIRPIVYQDGDGNYEPFYSSAAPFDKTLRALPSGVKDTYKNGILTRRVGIATFDGSEDEAWTNYQGICFEISVDGKKYGTDQPLYNLICDKLVVEPWNILVSKINDLTIKEQGGQSNNHIYVKNTSCATVRDFRTWLQSNPITIWYELEIPNVKLIEKPFIETYYPWTNIWNDSTIPTRIKVGFKNRLGEFYTKKDIDKLLEGRTNENLLANSDWQNGIINQKGQTSYNVIYKYGIDMWYMISAGTLTVNEKSISVSSDLKQFFDRQLPNGDYTFAISVDGKLYTYTFKNFDGSSNLTELMIGGKRLGLEMIDRKFVLYMNGSTFNIDFMKLEKGSIYTGMQAWNKSDELLKCYKNMVVFSKNISRFASIGGTSGLVSFQLPTKMRRKPEVSCSDMSIIYAPHDASGDVVSSITSLEVRNFEDDEITIRFNGSFGGSNWKIVSLRINIMLDANVY